MKIARHYFNAAATIVPAENNFGRNLGIARRGTKGSKPSYKSDSVRRARFFADDIVPRPCWILLGASPPEADTQYKSSIIKFGISIMAISPATASIRAFVASS